MPARKSPFVQTVLQAQRKHQPKQVGLLLRPYLQRYAQQHYQDIEKTQMARLECFLEDVKENWPKITLPQLDYLHKRGLLPHDEDPYDPEFDLVSYDRDPHRLVLKTLEKQVKRIKLLLTKRKEKKTHICSEETHHHR